MKTYLRSRAVRLIALACGLAATVFAWYTVGQQADREARAQFASRTNLATGVLTVREAKTAAGSGREVDIPGGLLDVLKEHKTHSDRTAPGDPVFTTRRVNGRAGRQEAGNVRESLKVAIRRANVELGELGIEPISDRVSPHSLRRTYASLRGALRDDPVYIAEQLGHEDATFTFRVYQRAVKRRDRLTGNYLAAFDRALDWALTGTSAGFTANGDRAGADQRTRQSAQASGKPTARV